MSSLCRPTPPPRHTFVYVAGPISKGDQFLNVRRGILVAEQLRAEGMMPFCPHLSALWAMIHPVGYEAWMDLDFAWIERCDALYRMPGDSPGADREVAHASRINVPVFHDIAHLVAWARGRA